MVISLFLLRYRDSRGNNDNKFLSIDFRITKMMIKIKNISSLEKVINPYRLLYSPQNKLFSLDYSHTDYLSFVAAGIKDISKTRKMVVINEETGNISHIEEGAHLLEITSNGKLYYLKNKFPNVSDICAYNLKNSALLATIPTNLCFGYGSSCLIGGDIFKLFIAFYGSDYHPGVEGILIIDVKEDGIIDQVSLGSLPRLLLATPQKDKLFIQVRGPKLLTLDARSHNIVDSNTLDFAPFKAILDSDNLLFVVFKTGIKILNLKHKEIIETIPIPEVCDIAPTNNRQYFVLLLQRLKPSFYVDRIALYDMKNREIVDVKYISSGKLLTRFEDGRIFFTEVKDFRLQLNEVLID